MNNKLVKEFMRNYRFCPYCDEELIDYKLVDDSLVINCPYKNCSWSTELSENEVLGAVLNLLN